MNEIEKLQKAINLIKKRKDFLCNDHRYPRIMQEIDQIIQDNNLTDGETKDFFSLACTLNSIKNGQLKGITSSWIVLENQNR